MMFSVKRATFLIVLFLIVNLYAQAADDSIPIPQVATQIDYSQQSLGGGVSDMWTYDIPWSWQEVSDYFSSKAAQYGWQPFSQGGLSVPLVTSQDGLAFKKENKILIIRGSENQEQSTRFMVAVNELPQVFGESILFKQGPQDESTQDTPSIIPGQVGSLPNIADIDVNEALGSILNATPFDQVVKDVPIHPGSKQLNLQQRGTDVTAVFTSSAEPKNIESFYTNSMKNKGWTLVSRDDSAKLKKSIQGMDMPAGSACPTCPDTAVKPVDITSILDRVDVIMMRFEKKDEDKACMISVMPLGAVGATTITIDYQSRSN